MPQLFLGIIQGITEWLPISSEGVIFLISLNFFTSLTLADALALALWLHLGTFLAALLYFRDTVTLLIKELFNWKRASEEAKNVWVFLILATSISGTIGILLLRGIDVLINDFVEGVNLFGFSFSFAEIIIGIIGVLLLISGVVQKIAQSEGKKEERELTVKDSILLGIVQGFAVLPGLSRSGLTVSTLLLRGFEKRTTLQLSFILSMPIVLGGNIIVNIDKTFLSFGALLGLTASFIFGYFTINALMRIAEKVQFGTFVILFGLITLLSLGVVNYV